MPDEDTDVDEEVLGYGTLVRRKVSGNQITDCFLGPPDVSLQSLEEAQQTDDGAVVIEVGEHCEFQLVLTMPALRVRCDGVTLLQLFKDLEELCGQPCVSGLSFERAVPGSYISEDLLVSEDLHLTLSLEDVELRSQIREVLAGTRRRIAPR